MRIRNIFGNRYRGTIGKDIVASSWKGIRYVRAYKVPTDPKSELQLRHRAIFAKAVETWHALDPRQRDLYNKAAVRMTGYNLFLREYIKAVESGREPEIMHVQNDPPQTPERKELVLIEVAQGPQAVRSETLSAYPESPNPTRVSESQTHPT